MPVRNEDECDDLAHERELRESWQASHERVHELENSARELASKNVDVRLAEMNRFREENLQDRGKYATREYVDGKNDLVDARIKIIENVRSNLEGRIWAIGAVIVVINLALLWWGHK